MSDFEDNGRDQDALDADDLTAVKLDPTAVEPDLTEPVDGLTGCLNHVDQVDRIFAHADALRWSSRLTTRRHDPLQVIANAEPMFAFLAAAIDNDDLQLRRTAGNLQNANDDEREPDDDGAGFALRAAVLYGAMTGTA
jgi:hypothetical protein